MIIRRLTEKEVFSQKKTIKHLFVFKKNNYTCTFEKEKIMTRSLYTHKYWWWHSRNNCCVERCGH